ncbi:4Fe-4S binding protein [Thiolapillus sp.]
MNKIQKQRLAWRTGFFLLFILAPVLDIFRFDLNQNHFILLTHPWTLGIDAFKSGQISALEMTLNMGLRFFLPLALVVGIGFWVAWKWGRLYCGWLCPHFSVVETINYCMRRASGKLSLWDRETLPTDQADGTHVPVNKKWWWTTALAILGFSFVWAVVLITYLLPPKEIYSNLFHASLTRNQMLFIGVATILFVIEFTVARHLFCRFGCAAGLLQSLVWMGNKKALVVGFDRARSTQCVECDASCEHACPMRLKPRSIKRKMFTCTQCMQCVEACEKVHEDDPRPPLLHMLSDQCALDVSLRDFGQKPSIPADCFPPIASSTKHKKGSPPPDR